MREKRRTKRNLEVPLERDELVAIGKEAGETERRIILLEAEKKRQADIFKGEIEELGSRVRELLEILRSGANVQEVEVEIRYHEPAKGKRSVIRLDSGACYAVEDMTRDEIAADAAEPPLPYGAESIAALKALLNDDPSIDAIDGWAKAVYPQESEREIVGAFLRGLKKRESAKTLDKAADAFGLYKLAMRMPTPAATDQAPASRLASLFRLGAPSADEIGVALNAWGVTDEDVLEAVTRWLGSMSSDAAIAKLEPHDAPESAELHLVELIAEAKVWAAMVDEDDGGG